MAEKYSFEKNYQTNRISGKKNWDKQANRNYWAKKLTVKTNIGQKKISGKKLIVQKNYRVDKCKRQKKLSE